MELWIPITICAAFMQNLRSALQKYLKSELGTSGATFSRFFYAAPLAMVYVLCLHEVVGIPWPGVSIRFFTYSALGGAAQIIATALLISLFSLRNFAVGTTYSSTEVVQTALFSTVLLGESIGGWGMVAILISLIGVIVISIAKGEVNIKNILLGLTRREAIIGIASGAFFGISAVVYRAAALSLESDNPFMQASTTLAVVTAMQTLGMAAYLRRYKSGEISKVLRSWRISGWVGISGMLGSVGWFTAMTLQNAAYVRALGQIELVFTFLASYCFFKEKTTWTEILGILLVVSAITLLVLSR